MSVKDWRELSLEAVCLKITDGAHSSPPSVPSGKPMASVKDLTSFGIRLESCRRIPEEDFKKLVKQGCQPIQGDVLIAKDGATALDTVCEVKRTEEVVLLSSVAILRPNQSIINSSYLHYFLDASTTRSYLKGNFTSGAAIPRVVLKDLKRAAITVPPLPVQQRIASILSAYDDLIENSQRRIRILESMARALYREWFVHFRFPGHETIPRISSPLGEIPQGWEVKTVEDILARRPAGSVYRDGDVQPEGDIPVIDQSTKEILGFHDNAPDHNASSALPMAIFGDHTCKMQLLIEPFSVGPNVVPFVADKEIPTAYVFYTVNSLVHTQEYKRHWTQLTAKEVVIADRETAQRFASLIQPMLITQQTHRKAIRNLRRTRDLLLPSLLSGQVSTEVNHTLLGER